MELEEPRLVRDYLIIALKPFRSMTLVISSALANYPNRLTV